MSAFRRASAVFFVDFATLIRNKDVWIVLSSEQQHARRKSLFYIIPFFFFPPPPPFPFSSSSSPSLFGGWGQTEAAVNSGPRKNGPRKWGGDSQRSFEVLAENHTLDTGGSPLASPFSLKSAGLRGIYLSFRKPSRSPFTPLLQPSFLCALVSVDALITHPPMLLFRLAFFLSFFFFFSAAPALRARDGGILGGGRPALRPY